MSTAGSSGGSAFSFQAEDDSQATRQSAQSSRLSTEQSETGSSWLALSPNQRKSNDLSELTVDKLRFDALGLHGRDDEIAILRHHFELLTGTGGGSTKRESENDRRLCLIAGQSGTGKTKLAETLKEPVSRINGLFVNGKFDLNLRNQPYSGISNACAEICSAILEIQGQEPARAKVICDNIVQSLGNELALLVHTIPILAEIINMSDLGTDDSITEVSLSTNDCKNQINFAFVRFLRVVASHFFPLVLVLDDLQWADVSSFDLLEVLMTDQGNTKLMVIGIYRSNEVDETHIFHRYLQEFETRSLENEFSLTKIHIHNLDIRAVNTIIRNVLACDDNRTLGLADVCFKKTHGNPFHLVHFISMLYENHLLHYNFGTLTWLWNNEEIEVSTHASDNVVDLIKRRMNELQEDCLEILKVASCLGSTFEQRILQLVWAKFRNVTVKTTAVIQMFAAGIKELVKEELFVILSNTPPRIGWVHDKIHEAAIALVSPSDRDAFHDKIGHILATELDEKELDGAIFVIADLLNGSSSASSSIEHANAADHQTRLKLSRLNLKASQKAVRLSAFESAAKYAGKGIDALPETAWDDDCNLCLQLHNIGAKAEGFIGNVETMEKYCQVVLAQDRPIEDKFDVYNTLVDSMTNQCKIQDAADLLLDILGKFRCRFPRNPALIGLGVVNNLIWIQGTMKSRETSKLVAVGDGTRINLMRLLDKLATCFYMLEDDRLPLVMFRSLNWTIKYGNCAFSALAFATTGMILTGLLGDLQGGAKYGQHALTLLNNVQSTSMASRTMFSVYSFLFPWTQPGRMVLKPLLQVYDLGLRTGDTESATYAIYFWLAIKYMIGSPLESLKADVALYLKQMIDLKRAQAVKITKCLYQMILNLMGENNDSEDPLQFFGQGLSEEDLETSKTDKFWNATVVLSRGVLWTFFGEHVRHAEMVRIAGYDYVAKAHLASPNIMMDIYLNGISCYAAARETGKKRKYGKLANICRSKIRAWLQMGNPNVKHYDTFLDAEALALKGKNFAAIKQYEATILQAVRCGYQHDAALASERLGEFQLSVMKDKEEAAYRFREAEKYWQSWGAFAKVQHLERKYAHIFRKDPMALGEILTLHEYRYDEPTTLPNR